MQRRSYTDLPLSCSHDFRDKAISFRRARVDERAHTIIYPGCIIWSGRAGFLASAKGEIVDSAEWHRLSRVEVEGARCRTGGGERGETLAVHEKLPPFEFPVRLRCVKQPTEAVPGMICIWTPNLIKFKLRCMC
jgi:hypothetical protein